MPRAATGRGCSKSSRASPRSSTTPPAAPAVSKESPCRSGFNRELFVAQADPTSPAREMQSGIRCRIALACSCTIATQHEQKQPPSSYRRERHATGVDGKLPRELLGRKPTQCRDRQNGVKGKKCTEA